MYGLNNNTGTAYSQANNNISQLNRKINNAEKGAQIAKNLNNGINALKGLQSESGWKRLQTIGEIIAMGKSA